MIMQKFLAAFVFVFLIVIVENNCAIADAGPGTGDPAQDAAIVAGGPPPPASPPTPFDTFMGMSGGYGNQVGMGVNDPGWGENGFDSSFSGGGGNDGHGADGDSLGGDEGDAGGSGGGDSGGSNGGDE